MVYLLSVTRDTVLEKSAEHVHHNRTLNPSIINKPVFIDTYMTERAPSVEKMHEVSSIPRTFRGCLRHAFVRQLGLVGQVDQNRRGKIKCLRTVRLRHLSPDLLSVSVKAAYARDCENASLIKCFIRIIICEFLILTDLLQRSNKNLAAVRVRVRKNIAYLCIVSLARADIISVSVCTDFVPHV